VAPPARVRCPILRQPSRATMVENRRRPNFATTSETCLKLVRVAAALSLLLALPALAAQPGFAFLEVPAGARAAALGGAYASVATGAEAAFWNPAGLG